MQGDVDDPTPAEPALPPTPPDPPSDADETAEPAAPTPNIRTDALPTLPSDAAESAAPTRDIWSDAPPAPPSEPESPARDIWSDSPPAPPTAPESAGSEPEEPRLPASEAKQPAPMAPEPRAPTPGAPTWYRSDRDRYRSVHRRANPWYRRLARGLVGLTFVAAAGAALYLGAQLVQDFLDRERLPAEGADVPSFRATSFEIRSTAPAPEVDGTLTLDASTGAFEFVGRGTGPQATTQVVSPDGERLFIRSADGPWVSPGPGDVVANDVARAARYLVDDDSADDILTRELRRRYVELVDRIEIGSGADELRRYEMELDTASFSDNSPIEYQAFEEDAIPGVVVARDLAVAITLDRDDVLVAVDDAGTNWSWQRLGYSDQPFTPTDPAGFAGGS